ncbi:TonB-dependent receptor domain-containing protein [Aquimarina rhabdastrellae]
MKNFILRLMLFCIGLVSYAQNSTYTGIIFNAKNTPITGATIYDLNNPKNGSLSDINGRFTISLQESNPRVSISYMGYITQEVILKNQDNAIVLIAQDIALDEVVISASRELQKRAEVPAAISVLSSKSIKEAKAFGIEQLTNQVPGVFMSSSKVASNEQHFTATRSPISTKSLFLFLEDGLPIRPTAVFNHNTLLEMNATAFDKIEVLKGPASSIYGSEAIGGSFNFITKNPTKDLSGSLGFQINDLGLTKVEAELADYTSNAFGFYLGTHYVQRNNGLIAHSDYEKFALTFKTLYHLNAKATWTSVIDLIDYRSDMTGSLTEENYFSENYLSNQTFTQRDALSFRFRNTLDYQWNIQNKTSFNLIYRDNRMDQNPSYRIRQFRNQGQLTGMGSGEVNSNQFNSFMGLIQHKVNFGFADSSLILGTSIDYSPQDYVAQKTAVTVDPSTGQNIDFTIQENDFILNYEADIYNYAGYLQYEISPIEALKITGALRYDAFTYDYNNRIDGTAGAQDSKTHYTNFSPKLGINYNFNTRTGIYANYANGFTPPQTSSLYRNRFVGVDGQVFDLKPSRFDNFEIGGYTKLNQKLKFDIALYLLEGKNRLVTLRNDDDTFFNANVGKTRSYGIEYGITYNLLPNLILSHQGSYAQHRYVDFVDRDTDYSDTDIPIAPNLIGFSALKYNFNLTHKIGMQLALEHELMGKYNSSFENQVVLNEDPDNPVTSTATYAGHNIFNARATLAFKSFEIWGHVLNITDKLYATRVSYSNFRNNNSYTVGNPRAFHLGIRYSF